VFEKCYSMYMTQLLCCMRQLLLSPLPQLEEAQVGEEALNSVVNCYWLLATHMSCILKRLLCVMWKAFVNNSCCVVLVTCVRHSELWVVH
jgi:hypothetical protein